MMKFAPEGYPFIAVFGGIWIIVLAVFGFVPSLLPLLLTAFMLYFFRDPERTTPAEPDIFVSPADGKVIVVRDVREDKYLNAAAKQVSIFMSPLNVHVNRIPCDGTIKAVRHNCGTFLAAYKDEACLRNENIEMVLATAYGDILVRQVAGFVARRAVCRKHEGDEVKRGERYGIIKFSSRLDIYLPAGAAITVKTGDVVKAGETVIGGMEPQPRGVLS